MYRRSCLFPLRMHFTAVVSPSRPNIEEPRNKLRHLCISVQLDWNSNWCCCRSVFLSFRQRNVVQVGVEMALSCWHSRSSCCFDCSTAIGPSTASHTFPGHWTLQTNCGEFSQEEQQKHYYSYSWPLLIYMRPLIRWPDPLRPPPQSNRPSTTFRSIQFVPLVRVSSQFPFKPLHFLSVRFFPLFAFHSDLNLSSAQCWVLGI